MTTQRSVGGWLLFVLMSSITACGTLQKYTTNDFNLHIPKTILVLPPENTTSNTEVVEKSYPFIFSKLAQRGYYVISPELAMQLFRANRLNDAGRLNRLPLDKFREVFGVDAVLKTRVTEWSSKYVVVSSAVSVGFEMSLFDTRTGKLLWSHENTLSKTPDSGGSGLAELLLGALVNAAATSYEPIAAENAGIMISTLPLGGAYALEP